MCENILIYETILIRKLTHDEHTPPFRYHNIYFDIYKFMLIVKLEIICATKIIIKYL